LLQINVAHQFAFFLQTRSEWVQLAPLVVALYARAQFENSIETSNTVHVIVPAQLSNTDDPKMGTLWRSCLQTWNDESRERLVLLQARNARFCVRYDSANIDTCTSVERDQSSQVNWNLVAAVRFCRLPDQANRRQLNRTARRHKDKQKQETNRPVAEEEPAPCHIVVRLQQQDRQQQPKHYHHVLRKVHVPEANSKQ
jgi:hypothetical protein